MYEKCVRNSCTSSVLLIVFVFKKCRPPYGNSDSKKRNTKYDICNFFLATILLFIYNRPKQTTASGWIQTPKTVWTLKIHKEGIPLRPTVNNIGAPTYELSKYLAGLLSQLTGNSAHHVKNSFQFIQISKSLRVQPEDIMVSFDVVSLCTNVSVVH